ncbi:hypothetical protein Sp245p_35090 (plasmid) [Azospirillum baldaniorum]|uniref:Uncharacterized protein n=1 Tax=Azospirillum baldaniorum TaxID=1064539 RepID=A0A9P1K0T9_9PROT|nr:hypothetical protein Sp245p_35090 [Azospirillum baldaniorum]CCD03482.1 protein of unknown function [Azospirillum baldaniorum]
MGADEVGESVMASIASTCILVCHCGRRLARGVVGRGALNANSPPPSPDHLSIRLQCHPGLRIITAEVLRGPVNTS